MISPYFAEMSNEFVDSIFIKLDVDELPDVAMKYEVNSMPTFLFIKNGNIVNRFSGASVSKLREIITDLQ